MTDHSQLVKTLRQLARDMVKLDMDMSLPAGSANPEDAADAIDALQAERDALARTAKSAGVCMTCAIQAPEPYGCTDCLNTGWDGGSPPNSPEELRALAQGMIDDFARMKTTITAEREALQARVAEFEAGLRRIVDAPMIDHRNPANGAQHIARALLERKDAS